MDQLWAPWRIAYLTQPSRPVPTDDCFICTALNSTDDRATLLVQRSTHSCAILNRYPYNNGHVLVAPHAHKGGLDELTTEETLEIHGTIARIVRILGNTIRAEGFNLGVNLGRVAGAGLPGHLHWHVVPRWNGDTNFMPVVSDVKVIVQSLDAVFDLLHKELGRD
jgi:ATP adenylyltransferase